MILFKTVIFSLLVPGTVVGIIPYLLITHTAAVFQIVLGPFRYGGVVPIIAGIAFYIASAKSFVIKGKGTPAPIDPPRLLVTSGPYRLTRNPILILIGEVVLCESVVLLVYLFFICLAFNLFIVFYEEPHLRKIFGPAYEKYCSKVPRWIPSLHRRLRK